MIHTHHLFDLPEPEEVYKLVNHKLVKIAYKIIFKKFDCRFIAGGLATQFHIPKELRRGSRDMDITDTHRYTSSMFKKDFKRYKQLFDNQGYDIYLSKKNSTFNIHICNYYREENEDEVYFFNVQFPRVGKSYFERNKDRIQRELDNSILHEFDKVPVRVQCPEDIIVRKILRTFNFVRYEEIEKFEPPKKIDEHLDMIWKKRQEILSKKGDYELSELTMLRQITDSYDMRVLSGNCNIKEDYFMGGLIDLGKSSKFGVPDATEWYRSLCPEAIL